MKVVNVVTGDEGGGGRAAYRLNKGLKAAGCDARLYVASKFHHDDETVVFQPKEDLASKFKRLLFRTRLRIRTAAYPYKLGWSWEHECQRGGDPIGQLPPADIYNLHTISNFFDTGAFFPSVATRTPTVWTIHLMAPFTGGCYHASGCDRFECECGLCPMLGAKRENDPSRAEWKDKDRIYSSTPADRLSLVTPSEWMRSRIARSALMKRFDATVIPNGIDTDVYKPRDRAFARQALDLPPDARVLLFVSQHGLWAKGKGFDLLMEMIGAMRGTKGLHLLTLGPDFRSGVGIPHKHLGHVFNDNLLSLIYNAADVLVIPSLEDNLPTVVLEAMACGIPVAGFATGGIPEVVRKGETGEIVPKGDVGELRLAVEALLRDDELRARLSRQCREKALREYSLPVVAARYLKLYETMLERGHGH
ncbi:MAG: glycosyltransferase [Chthoniobacteraceae bacterium]|jgi:glycosyltransferase involved in cell wall biosynthesis